MNLQQAYEVIGNNGGTVNITVALPDLIEFSKRLINETTNEVKERIKQGQEDLLLSVDETMNRLKVKDRTTLWRWEKKGYLMPVRSGKKCLYKTSDVERLLNAKSATL